MSDNFDDAQFDEWLGGVTATAPEDLRGTVRRMVTTDHRPTTAVDTGRSHLARLWVAVAATVAVGVVGLVALVDRGGNTSVLNGVPPTAPRPTVTAPATTVAAIPAPVLTSAPSSTIADPPEHPVLTELGLDVAGVVLSGEEALAALGTIDDHRVGVLRESTGFRATATIASTSVLADGSTPRGGPPPTVVDLTVLANGDLWADYPNGDWYRFDGRNGVGRNLHTVDSDGTKFPLEFNRIPYQHSYSSVLGHDPLELSEHAPELFTGGDPLEVEVTATVFEGGPAAEVRFDSAERGTQRYVIDLRSGLVVRRETTEPSEDGTLGFESSLSDVTDADELPVAVEPPLPAGLEWQRLDGPTDVYPVTIEAARSAFGAGLMLPRSVIDTGTLRMEHSASTADGLVVDPADPNAELRYISIIHTQPVGLLRTTVETHTERLAPNGTLPDGYVEIGDRICPAPRGCSWEPLGLGGIMLEEGALAGVWLRTGLRNVGTQVDGVSISIQAPTTDEAIALANTFVIVP